MDTDDGENEASEIQCYTLLDWLRGQGYGQLDVLEMGNKIVIYWSKDLYSTLTSYRDAHFMLAGIRFAIETETH